MGEFIISMIKLIVALLTLPVVAASCMSISEHLRVYPHDFGRLFINGGATFLFMFIFLHQFEAVYAFGKKMVEGMFGLLEPLNTMLSHVFSFYLIILLPTFFVTRKLVKITSFDVFFIFATGFCFVMHIILAAQDLQRSETSIVKPEYMFMINIIVVVNILLLVFAVELIIGKGEFAKFMTNFWYSTLRLYRMCIGKAML